MLKLNKGKMKIVIGVLCLFMAVYSCKPDQSDGNKILRNGYAYKNHTELEGPRPIKSQVVSIDFEIIDDFGNVLSDSRKANIRPTIQIPESMDAQMKRNPLLSLVEIMTEGDSASVYVPVDSLSSPPQEFLQSKSVEYRVVMLHIESQEDYMERIGDEQMRIQEESLAEARDALDRYKAGEFDNITVEKNGEVKLAIINETDGVKADFDELAFVHYYGFFKDGNVFDSSYKLGKPYAFRVGRGTVIQGWDIAIPDIPEGATAIIDIPYQMAYGPEGKTGSIPPASDLIFWVKLDRVEKSKKPEENN